jgi:hypothetical protein
MKADIKNDERELDIMNTNFQHTEKALFHAPMRELEESEAKAIEFITGYYRIKREELNTKSKKRQEIFNEAQERVQRRLERRRAIAAPLKKLPPEILSEIFIMHVEMDGSPWVPLKVSRWWMRVSTSTFRLWRTIRVIPRMQSYDSGAAHQQCSSKTQLQRAMRRAGMVPIRLHLDFSSCSWETDRDILQFVVESLDRFRSLELARSPCLRGAQEETKFLDSLRYGVPRNLRELTLGHGWEIEPVVDKLLGAYNTSREGLRFLTLSSTRWLPLLGQHRKLFLDLQSFSFSGRANSSAEDELLQKCFQSIRRLECLSINVSLLPLVEVVTLVDNLQELDIRDTSLEPLQFLRIPNLKKLVLTSVRPKYPQSFTISLPQLEVLQVKSSPWTSIRALHCPALHELLLGPGLYEKGPARPQLNFIWSSDSRCLNPRILHLQVGAKDSALITTLRKIKAIEQLRLTLPVDSMLGDAFFDAFSAPKTNHRTRWLPKLRSIEITCTDSESSKCVTDTTKLKDGLQKIVKSRAEWASIASAVLNTISTRSTPHVQHRHELAIPGALSETRTIRDDKRMVADTWAPIESSDVAQGA